MSGSNERKRILLMGDARQVHLHRWSRYLSENDFNVLTLSLEPVGEMPGSCEQIGVHHILPDFLRYPAAVPTVRRFIRRFRPHVINAHFLPNYGVIAALSRFAPWVLSTWGSDIMLLPQRGRFHMMRTRFVIRRATYITSDAEVMSGRLAELGADPHRVITFPYGVDRSVFRPSVDSVSGEGPRILCNRKIELVYNVRTLVSAFPEVVRLSPAARLTLAGSGSMRDRLEREARLGRAAQRIRFIGDIPHGDIPALLREHDIFVSLALSDTTSVSLLEAMSCGLFPIVSDIPANREWIEHGKNGFVIPPLDSLAVARAIIEAWTQTALRDSARQHNAALIEARADWYKNMSLAKDLFDRLASSGDTTDAG